MTTERSIRLYRAIVLQCFTIYIKTLPAGPIMKVGVDINDSARHLYNLFQSHSTLGTAKRQMLVLPTANGGVEIDSDVFAEDDFVGVRATGKLPLKRYGLTERNVDCCLFFFPGYLSTRAPNLIRGYVHENSNYRLSSDYAIMDYVDESIVGDRIHADPVQQAVRSAIARQYEDQVKVKVEKYRDLAEKYRRERERQRLERVEQKRIEQEMKLKDEEEKQRRLDAQLKR